MHWGSIADQGIGMGFDWRVLLEKLYLLFGKLSFHPMIPLSSYLQRNDENYIDKEVIINEEKIKIPEQLDKNEKLAQEKKIRFTEMC